MRRAEGGGGEKCPSRHKTNIRHTLRDEQQHRQLALAGHFWRTHMVYEIKDQDVTPPVPATSDERSSRRDAAGALGIAVLTIVLIASIIVFQIL